MKRLLRNGLLILSFTLVVFFLSPVLIGNYIADGDCMRPTIPNASRLLINRVAYTFHPPQRGDLVLYQKPTATSVESIKRIIALPGETIEIKSEVYINGQKLQEPYVEEPARYTMQTTTVPAHHYFILGDNRNDSVDSHCGWTVPRENILGKLLLLLWPASLWGIWEKTLIGVLASLLLLVAIRKSRLRLLLYMSSAGLFLYLLAMLIKTFSG